MFGDRFFGARFFANRFFGPVADVTPPAPVRPVRLTPTFITGPAITPTFTTGPTITPLWGPDA